MDEVQALVDMCAKVLHLLVCLGKCGRIRGNCSFGDFPGLLGGSDGCKFSNLEARQIAIAMIRDCKQAISC